MERGKPDSLSGAVQGGSPRSRPSASEGDGGAGKGCGRKRTPLCNGVDRGGDDTLRRKAADFLQV